MIARTRTGYASGARFLAMVDPYAWFCFSFRGSEFRREYYHSENCLPPEYRQKIVKNRPKIAYPPEYRDSGYSDIHQKQNHAYGTL